MSEYSCISLDALSTQVNTLPNGVNQWRFLAVSPEGVTYLVNAASIVPENSVCTIHIVDNAITCDKISAKEIHTKHVSNIDHTCIGGLGTASTCAATSFANSAHSHTCGDITNFASCVNAVVANCGYTKCTGTSNLTLGTTSTTAAKGDHTHPGYLSTSGDAASAKKLSSSYICFGSNCIWIE